MRNLISNPWFWCAAAGASLVLHILLVWRTHDGTLVARCGATWVIFAGAVIARPILRMGYETWYRSSKTIDGGHFLRTPEEIEEERQSAIDASCVQWFGPWLAGAGTALWAYGDLAANAIMNVHRYR